MDITAVAEKPRWKGREKEHLQDLLRPSRPSKTSGKEAKMASQRAVLGRSWGALGASSVLLGASKNTPRGPKRSQEAPKRSPRANRNGIRAFWGPFGLLLWPLGVLLEFLGDLLGHQERFVYRGHSLKRAQGPPKRTPRGAKRLQGGGQERIPTVYELLGALLGSSSGFLGCSWSLLATSWGTKKGSHNDGIR